MTSQRALIGVAMVLYLFAGMCIQVVFDGRSVFVFPALVLGILGGGCARRVTRLPRPPKEQ